MKFDVKEIEKMERPVGMQKLCPNLCFSAKHFIVHFHKPYFKAVQKEKGPQMVIASELLFNLKFE